jgi:uncharacterized cupredoxin-like copper-binding protein
VAAGGGDSRGGHLAHQPLGHDENMRLRVLLGLAALPALAACFSGAEARERTVVIDVHHSAFGPTQLSVERGTTVRFVIRNGDPIDHEFILGNRKVQDRHEVGRQRHHHGVVPGEVSVPAGTTRSTTYTFTRSGTLIFGCHLPGHYAYGMRGELTVSP